MKIRLKTYMQKIFGRIKISKGLFQSQQLLAGQQEYESVAAAGFQPSERQFGIGGFQYVAVVSDFDQQYAFGIEVFGCVQQDLAGGVQTVFAAA